MKVDSTNRSIVLSGEKTENLHTDETTDKNTGKDKKASKTFTSIYAGDLKIGQEKIDEKERLAAKESIKILLDQFGKDLKIDGIIKESQKAQDKYLKEYAKANEEVKEWKEKKERLKEEFEIEDDSQEQKDLELLIKARKVPLELSEEEKQRLKKMGENRTEYQKFALQYTKAIENFQKK